MHSITQDCEQGALSSRQTCLKGGERKGLGDTSKQQDKSRLWESLAKNQTGLFKGQRLRFLGGPVVETHFPRREHGFDPWSGKFHTPHAARKKTTVNATEGKKTGEDVSRL